MHILCLCLCTRVCPFVYVCVSVYGQELNCNESTQFVFKLSTRTFTTFHQEDIRNLNIAEGSDQDLLITVTLYEATLKTKWGFCLKNDEQESKE